tara:strand:+ start:5679 stop:6857 length:1179 start_codon:yes stop_codon:yes gene_type:complete
MEFEINNDFDFNLPNKKINILDDNILFNKSKISDDVLSMSSREDISIADEIESNADSDINKNNNFVFKQASMGSNSDDFSEISIDDVPKPQMQREQARNTIQDEMTEKKEILYQFDRLKSKGVKVPYDFNMNSNIHEMRSSYERIKREKEIDASIRFQRKMMMGFVTGCEFLNTRYNPFSVELDGWSEQVHESVDDYDDIFEELHDKYKDSGSNMAPELRLLISLGGSAFMFHLTKKMFSNSQLPKVEEVLQRNPDLMKKFQEASAMEYMRGSQQQSGPFGMQSGPSGPSGPSMPSFSRNKPDASSGGDLFGMVSNLFNTTQSNPTTDVDDIINNVHSKINLVPTEENMMETLTVTEDEITSLIEDTADIKLINSAGKKSKKSKKDTRVLNL